VKNKRLKEKDIKGFLKIVPYIYVCVGLTIWGKKIKKEKCEKSEKSCESAPNLTLSLRKTMF
jgi:hypothetical protein